MGSAFNPRSPAVKRILQELREVQADDSSEYIAEAVEENIFEWLFVLRGPADTEFAGGVFHGRILLPSDYPFKPPSFIMLSPTGRFEVNTKICLSISSHHPEHWQPSWSMRTALTALIAFLPTHGQGAIGSLDFSKAERRHLALKSRTQVPKFGGPQRQQRMRELHDQMLAVQSVPAQPAALPESPAPSPVEQAAILPEAASKAEQAAGTAAQPPAALSASSAEAHPPELAGQPGAAPAQARPSSGPSTELPTRQASAEQPQQQQQHLYGQSSAAPAGSQAAWEDRLLTTLAGGLFFLIVALLCRRVLALSGVDLDALLHKPT